MMNHSAAFTLAALLMLAAVAVAAPSAQAALIVTAAPKDAPISSARYAVRLREPGGSWKPAPIYAFFHQHDYNGALTAETQFVTFQSAGKIEVEVTVMGEADAPVLRPRSRGIAVQRTGNTLRFTMSDAARQLSLEMNGDPRHPLLLFSSTPEKDVPKPRDPGVTYFGSGYHKAGTIKCANSQGGGRTIYLAPGAVVEGALDIADCEGVTVRGRGILYCPHPKEGDANPSPLNISASKNVHLEGIVLVNRADNWTLRLVASRGVTVKGFRLLSEIRDGLDVINSQEVNVRDSFFMTHDDAVCLKGLQEGKNQPVEDVSVERCVVANMGGGNCLEIGYESATPVYRRIVYQDLDLIHSLPNGEAPDPNWPEAAISIHPTQMTEYGSPDYMGIMPPIRDVTYRDIRIEDCQDDFYFDIRPNRNSPGQGIENIRLDNISITDSPSRPSRVVGRKDHPIRHVTFRALTILGQPITDARQGRFQVENALEVVIERH